MTDPAATASGELLSRVQALNSTFARAVDHHEHDLLRDVLAVDVDYVTGAVSLHGVEAVIRRFADRRFPRTTRHQPGPPHVLRCTATVLETTSVWTCWAAHGDKGPFLGPFAVYSVSDFHDTWSLTDTSCRLARREIRSVFRDPALAPRD